MLPVILGLSLILSTALGGLALCHRGQDAGKLTNRSFKAHTRELLCRLNERGHASLLGILTVLLLLTGMLALVLQTLQDYWSVRSRAQQYLCFAYLLRHTVDYANAMEALNKSIRASQALPPYAGIPLRQGLKQAQEGLHLNYLARLWRPAHCRAGQNLSHLGQLPYQTLGMVALVRDGNEATMPGQARWQGTVPPAPFFVPHLRTADRFVLVGSYAFSPRGLEYRAREGPWGAP